MLAHAVDQADRRARLAGGKTIDAPAPYDALPLYVKAGSLTDRLGEFANGLFAQAKDINPLGRGED